MEDLYQDWIDFCEGHKDFDKSHFFELFKIGLNDEKLRKVLQYIPNSDDIFSRLKEVLDAGDIENHSYLLPARHHQLNQQKLIEVAKEWNKEYIKFCKSKEEMKLYQIVSNNEIVFSSYDEVWKERLDDNNPGAKLYCLLSDNVINSKLIHTKHSVVLFEATYAIAANYLLSWFICQPLIGIDLDFRKYFVFWKGGGFDALLEDKLLIGYFRKDY